MELLPISASLGAMGSLPGKLDALQDTKLKKEISKLRTRLQQLSKVRDPPHTARSWMEDVRQLSFAMENCVDPKTDRIVKIPRMFKVRAKEANKKYDKYQLERVPTRTDVFPIIDHRLPTVDGGRKTDPVIVGLHDEGRVFDNLCPLLTGDGCKDEFKVLSIVGVGGIGKTTLAKQLWRDKKLGGSFDCRAFVRTAKKSDMRRILRSILAQVRPDPPPDTNEVHELIHDLHQHLRNKRYFLIIDDLWVPEVWDVARRAFPKSNGSRILTTTEFENVALACCSYQTDYIFYMKPLSLSRSKELFTSGLGEGTDEIIIRCGGLPLAIISISSVIASQGVENIVQSREQIQNNLPTNTTPVDILKQVLNFCYNCLPSGLQTCLLHLSLYPENYIILKEDIMKQWVAEGFILEPTENEKMEVARNYFDKLVDMGMIQHIDVDYSEVLDYSDEVLYYSVHRTVHELITSKSIEENFVTVIDYSQGTVRLSNKVSRLSLQFGSATYATTPESIGLLHVRSLTFIGLESCFPPISEFKLLRFLTIHMWSDQPSTGVDLKPTSELVLLRSLQVTCNDTVHLPNLMQGPIHLETLEINARVVDIPANIVHLRSWLHLRLGVGTELPDVTGILKNGSLDPPISLDDSSIPPDSVRTINLLSPISTMPKWVGQLTNLCILKFVVTEVQRDDISNLQELTFLTVLSLHVQQQTAELSFATGKFKTLKFFEFRSGVGVLSLAFEKGAMPNLQRVKLGVNAHKGKQYKHFLAGIDDMLSIQKISVVIGSAAGADEDDLEAADAAIKEAIGRQHRKVSIKKPHMPEEEFHPPESHRSIQEQPSEHHDESGPPEKQHGDHPSASSEESQEEFNPREQQHSVGGKPPSASTEQPRVQPEQQLSIGGQHTSTSSEEPPHREKQSDYFSTNYGSIKRMPPRSAPSKNNNYPSPRQSEAKPRKNQQKSETERSMAYLAAVVAKVVVEGSLIKVQVAIKMEGKLPQSARRSLVFIADEFAFMQSFLNVIINEERMENELVRTWVRKIHELAYGLEDCMELVIHLDKEKPSLWCRIRKQHWSCIPAPLLPLDQAVDEIEHLKARVGDMSTRSTRYNIISDSGSNYDAAAAAEKQEPISCRDDPDATTAFNPLFEEAFKTTHKGRLRGLTQLLTKKEHDLGVISIWATSAATTSRVVGGDLGMVSIAWNAYTDRETCDKFSCRAWVKVMHPFNPEEFVRTLTAQFYTSLYSKEEQALPVGVQVLMKMKTARGGEDHQSLKDFGWLVMKNRFLVVLEDMHTMAQWESIRAFFPDMKNGSCVILSTQHFEVATLSVGHPYQVLHLNQLSDAHSVYAFFTKGSQYDAIVTNKKEAAEIWMKEHPLVGRESEMKDLGLSLVAARYKQYQVISVWGIAGVGKSALVKTMFCDRIVNGTLFQKYGWVDVAYPFNLSDFCRVLVSNFSSVSLQTTASADLCTKVSKDPILECREILRQYKCLVVIDGLQSREEWDLIQAALVYTSNHQNIIIAVTAEEEIATHCTRDKGHSIFNVKSMEADTAFELLRKGSQSDANKCTATNNAPASNSGVETATNKKEAAKRWMKAHSLVGRDSEMKDLDTFLVSARSKKYQVISVWGISGVGKSALVKNMFCNRIVKGTLFQKYGWVDVVHPFNIWDFYRVLLSNFSSAYLQASQTADLCTMDSKNPIVECREILTHYKCLVVIDGLQSTKEWDLIKVDLVSKSNHQNIIIAVTTNEEIATHCCGDMGKSVFNVKGLEADTALELFKKVSKMDTEVSKQQELTSICGGLPRVIVEIAVSFAKSPDVLKTALSTNSKFMLELEKDGEFHNLKGLFGWMNLYFRNCQDSLKPCILYLPIFPRNYLIRRRRLLRRWIAEGYSRDSKDESAEMNGEKQFHDLLDLSIIQQPFALGLGDTRMVSCQVNGFFREYIASRQMEENLMFELSGSSALTTQRTGRHLVIWDSWLRDRIVFESIDFSRLRSLTVFGEWKSFLFSESMKLLRVLDLEGAWKVEYSDLKKIVKLMCRLKFLSLRGCREICHLPSSIGGLRQLQSLDVRHTSIVTLPDNITKLESLQYIRAGTTAPTTQAANDVLSQLSNYYCGRQPVGVEVPPGIGKLTALHTLGVVNVSASGTKVFLEELKKLTHLRKLGVSGIRMKNSNKFIHAISVLVHLESLSVQLEKNNGSCLDSIPLPLQNLRSLKLYGLGNRLPNWSGQLTMLSKMDLEIARLTEEDYVSPLLEGVRVTPEGKKESTKGVIKILSELWGLCILRLRVHHLQDNVLDVSVITNDLEEYSFEKIKMFEIACSSSSRVTFGEKTMKHLEQLKVDCCSGSFLFGLKHLGELKEVLLKGSSYGDEALKTDLTTKLQDHPKSKKPAVKLEELPSRR